VGNRIDQSLFSIHLVEGLFVVYENVLECEVPGQHSSEITVPHLTDIL
jgi:hypothetical protein